MYYDIDESYINDCAEKIESFIGRSFKNVKVTPVNPDEVTSRTRIGFDAEDSIDRDEIYEVYYRIRISNVTKDDIFEDSGTMIEHFTDLIQEDMEHNSSAPDTIFVESDLPPKSRNKPFVFYVRSVL